MLAVKLRGEISGDGHLVVELPDDMEPGPVEVIVLQEAEKKLKRRSRITEATHPTFGMWADREEARDPVAFAAELRRRIESRADSRD
ncbi:MAG: hypothetical protein HZB55_14625 [Deltaproteobacteria bacterium]|nr:hypothetical protein [Deltaproteobacteria bacterium]